MLRRLLENHLPSFYGWRMVALGCAVRLLGGGLHLYGFTVFFLPITNELGLSRAATSLVFSLARAEGAIEGPVAGYLIDRYGPRPLMLAGIALSGVGYMALAWVNSYAALLAVYLGVISLSFSAGFMHSPMVLANSWFVRRRALAMTLISSSIGLGGTLVTPLLAFAVYTWGWRSAAFLAGLGLIVVGIPLVLPVRRSPESMGLLPDGDAPGGQAPDASPAGARGAAAEASFTVTEAMKTSAFWMLVLATIARVAAYNSITVHFIPMMVWKGVSEQRAAAMLATMALMSLPTHLMVGWIADFTSKPLVMAVSMIIGTVAMLLLSHADGEWPMWVFTVLFTFVEAVFPVSWATVGDFFGRKSFGTIRGAMSFFYLWGAALGPVVAGAVYDRYQSYAPLMLALTILFLTASCLYALLKKPGGQA
ncbi:MAG TPA: MFS transporter [candidate division Zixibacteria bacterium]|nr:MFS transporter [candidate division Zixibacteria bacterium]